MKNSAKILGLLCLVFIFSCTSEKEKFISENLKFVEAQTKLMLTELGEPTGKNYPRTVKDGKLRTTSMYDWTPGFFPGSLWYLYELSGDTIWRNQAEKWTESLEPLKTFTGHHDLGFMMYCSYGNAERLASKDNYKNILIESAGSLCKRYNDTIQSIKSWNKFKSWDDSINTNYAVIIDNMMNLEMLCYASKVSGNNYYKDVAIKHANTTLKNHFREDFSSYHVVDYDSAGQVRYKGTAQGFSDNSTWTRGQAWAIYGYTMMYRETKDPIYLDAAIKLTDFYLANLPEDLIPLWDFNVGQQGYTPVGRSNAVKFQEKLKDASAGAIVCSALFELGVFAENKTYIEKAVTMLKSLSSAEYRAKIGENGNFLIMHGVGSIPHSFEIDAPLVYADYYYLEALVRYKNHTEAL